MSRNTPSFPITSDASTTPNFVPVTTTTGFNQGDLVFLSGNDYQSCRPQVGTAQFLLNSTVPVLSGVNGGFGGSLGYFGATTNTSGASYVQNVAKLSNGNIVSAGINNSNNAAYFTIYNPDFTVAVSRVTLPTTFTSQGSANVGVTALTGGGFVIYFTGISSFFTYAVYSNTGTVVSALAQNSNVVATTTTYIHQVAALSGGGFVAAAFNSSYAATYAAFNASGAQQYTGSIAGGNLYGGPCMVAAGANNSFVLLFLANTNADYAWRHISSANTTLNSGLLPVSSASYANGYFSATTLDDGITVVMSYHTYASSQYRIGLVAYNTSTNTVATSVTYPIPNANNNIIFVSSCVRQIPNGNFLFALQTNSGQDMYQCMYSVFNSSCVPVGAVGATASDPTFKSMGWQRPSSQYYLFNSAMSVITLGSTIYMFYANDAGLANTGFTAFYSIDSTTYNYTSSASAPSIVSPYEATTNVAVGGVAFNTLTPTKTAYTPASNSAAAVRTSAFTATAPTTVLGQAATAFDVGTLTTGNFVVAYVNGLASPSPVVANVYSPTRSLITSVTISATSFGSFYSVRVSPLSNGRFVVVYATSTTSISFAVVSSSYSVIASGTISGLSMAFSSRYNYQGFAVSDLTGDRFIITASDSGTGFPRYYIYNASGTLITSALMISSLAYPNAVRGMPGGGFAVAAVYAASATYLFQYTELSTNTFAQIATSPFTSLYGGNGSNYNVNYALHATPQNQLWYYSLFPDGGGSGAQRTWFSSANQSVNTDISPGASLSFMLCPTSIGTPVGLQLNGGTTDITAYICNAGSYGVSTNLTGIRCDTNAAVSNYFPHLRAVPYIGNTVLLVYNDALNSNFLSFTVITAPNYSAGGFVANTTPSTVSSFATPNYPLVGVAANTAAAGGVGQVQTNGTAVLNSNYSASTAAQAFDYQTPDGRGVRGTISGRTITLLGN